jgi:hypothetical protein
MRGKGRVAEAGGISGKNGLDPTIGEILSDILLNRIGNISLDKKVNIVIPLSIKLTIASP